MLLSLFCCAGGLDLGFEQAKYKIGLAFDCDPERVASYNHNRPTSAVGHCADVRDLTVERLDQLFGGRFTPEGVIGGPPCQSFSQANRTNVADDPRHRLPIAYSNLIRILNFRSPIKFFVLENVPGLASAEHKQRFEEIKRSFRRSGFMLHTAIMNAADFGIPQTRKRLFLIGLNKDLLPKANWQPPKPHSTLVKPITVRQAIGGLPEPFVFDRKGKPSVLPSHPNHWCMRPKSIKFRALGGLVPGNGNNRSFKTLHWDKPSLTVAYGHREVHVHPECHRRLSVYEAMLLQGFPESYELLGTLSSQFAQVSEAVPPKLARAVAESIRSSLVNEA